MQSAEIERRSYLFRALFDQHNLIALGSSATFSAALASWLPLAAAGLAELGWLAVAPRSGRFRRAADRFDANVLGVASRRSAELEAAALGPTERARYAALRERLDAMLALCSAHPRVSFHDVQRIHAQLGALRLTFRDLLRAQQSLDEASTEIPATALAAELAELERTWSLSPDIEVRMGRRRALTLARSRLDERERLLAKRSAIEFGLSAVERGLLHARSRALAVPASESLAGPIGASLAELSAAESAVMVAKALAATVLQNTAAAATRS